MTLYWHIHHGELIEDTDNIQERIEYVRNFKPSKEIPTRLELMTPVKNQKLATKLLEEYIAIEDKAWNEYEAIKDKAYEEYEVIEAKARQPLVELHKKEHPDCPWNGKTIFPEESE